MREFLITRVAGKLLMITGAIGFVIVLRYDTIVARGIEGVVFGKMQLAALIYSIFLVIVGYMLDDFTKDL